MRRLLALFGFFCVIGASVCAYGAVRITDQLREFQNATEQKIVSAIERVYDGKLHPIVSIEVLQAEAGAAGAAGAVKPDGKRVELGYVPIVEDLEPINEPALEVAGLNVFIRLPVDKGVEGKIQQTELVELVKKLFPELQVDVKVQTVVKPSLVVNGEEDEPEPVATPGAPSEKLVKLSDWPKWLMPVAAMFAAFMLGFALFSIGRALVSSATRLADGMRELKPVSKLELSETAGLKGAAAPDAGVASATLEVADPTDRRDLMRTITAIKDVLKKEPGAFVRVIGTNERDLMGVRKLLTYLEEAELTVMLKALGAERMEMVGEIELASLKVDQFGQWASDLIEKLTVARLVGGSAVEKILGPERWAKLAGQSSQAILEAAERLNNAAVWRVVLELLPKADIGKAFHGADSRRWEKLVASALEGPKEIEAAADRLLSEVAVGGVGGAGAGKERARYYGRFLRPTLGEIIGMPVGEEDILLDQLRSGAPELEALVRENIWTARDFARVPKSYLTESFKRLANDRLLLLFLAMPPNLSGPLMELVPAGNKRIILADSIKKSLATSDDVQKGKAVQFARHYFEQLRQEALAGNFKLAEAGFDVQAAA